jgi:hypothetical protein
MNLIEPEEILAHFIQSQVTDLKGSRLSSSTETFDGTGAQTEFVVTNVIAAVTVVSVGGSTLYPYQDFQIDRDNKTITFNTAPASGTDNVSITYLYGTQWVFPDKPLDTLRAVSYPRIGVTKLTESSEPQGAYNDETYDTLTFQIDVVTYKDAELTIDTETKTNADVTMYLARQVINKIKTTWRNQLNTKLFNPILISNDPQPYNSGQNTHRRIVEYRFNAFNIGA